MHIASFIRQKSYEKVVYVLRRHPVTFVPYVLLFFVLLAVPVIVFFLITSLFPWVLDHRFLYPLGVLLGSAYYFGAFLFFYTLFTEYYLDMWIITNDRVIDVEQIGLFSQTISEFDLFRVQDVTTDIHGVGATVFHYGDVTVQTASQNTGIVFRSVPNPNKIREEIIRLSHIDQKYHFASPNLDQG